MSEFMPSLVCGSYKGNIRISRRQIKKKGLQVENTPVVILIDNNTLVKRRIRNVFEGHKVRFFEAGNRAELLRILSINKRVDLIITEVEIDNETGFDGIDLLRLVKRCKSDAHVVVLSSVGKKEVITRCLQEGAADYVLKPFEDEKLKKRLLKYINFKNLTESTTLQFNLKNYLDSEIYKAKKKDYCFSLLKIQFSSGAGAEQDRLKQDLYRYEEFIYNEMKSLFWESDLYIRLGCHSHLGFLPFCNREDAEVIADKIKFGFERIKALEPDLCDYAITYAFATYPDDGRTASELLGKFSDSELMENMPECS